MTRDLINSLKGTEGLAPLVRTATALSAKADLRGYQSCVARFHCGAFGDTQSSSVYIEAELQESDDDITYSAVADADLTPNSPATAITGTATATFFQSKTTGAHNIAGLYECGYRGSKRYLKVNVRYTGTHSTGTSCSVTFSASVPSYGPVFGNLT